MGWLVLPFAIVMMARAIDVGSSVGACLFATMATLTMPPLWKRIADGGHKTHARVRWAGATILGFVAMVMAGAAYSDTPQGKMDAVKRQAEISAKATALLASEKEAKQKKDAEIASGNHCLSGWDGSFPRLKEAVKRSIRNPRSFEHVETVRSSVDESGKFGLIMSYRAENGFGGVNVEAAGVEVDAKTCNFEQVDAGKLAKRLTGD